MADRCLQFIDTPSDFVLVAHWAFPPRFTCNTTQNKTIVLHHFPISHLDPKDYYHFSLSRKPRGDPVQKMCLSCNWERFGGIGLALTLSVALETAQFMIRLPKLEWPLTRIFTLHSEVTATYLPR